MENEKGIRMDVTQKKLCRSMEADLIRTEKAGIPIYISGMRKSPASAAKMLMLRENGSFYGSYRYDANGRLGLYFERVSNTAHS